MREVTVAAVQMRCCDDVQKNIANAERLVRQAAGRGQRSFSFRSCLNGNTSVRRGSMISMNTQNRQKKTRL